MAEFRESRRHSPGRAYAAFWTLLATFLARMRALSLSRASDDPPKRPARPGQNEGEQGGLPGGRSFSGTPVGVRTRNAGGGAIGPAGARPGAAYWSGCGAPNGGGAWMAPPAPAAPAGTVWPQAGHWTG